MAIGETLLKITDYPFFYSLILLWLRFSDIDPFSTEAVPFFAAAGFVGTLFAFLDPVGNILKYYLKWVQKAAYDYFTDPKLDEKLSFKILCRLNPKLREPPKINRKWSYIDGAFHTKSIELEKDRLVSSLYFLFVIMAIILFLHYTDIFITNYPEYLKNDYCDENCVYVVVMISLLTIAMLVSIVIGWRGGNLSKKVITVSTYLQAASSTFVPKTSTETLSRFIESGDWKTAEYWKNIVEDEYNSEEELKKEREQKLREHVGEIISQFSKFKKEKDYENQRILLAAKDLSDFSYRLTLEEQFKTFPLYDRLIEHLYTTESNEIYSLFEKYLQLEKKIQKGNSEWLKEKNEGIKKIINQLGLNIMEQHPQGIRADNEQWINTDLIKHDLDRFLTFERESLMPIHNKPNTALWQVRFFDSSTFPTPRNDVVAELNQVAAGVLSAELALLTKNLRESANYAGTDFNDSYRTKNELETKVDELFLSYEVKSEPLCGSCILCRNDQFFSKSIILKHEEKLKEFPKDLMSKDILITKPKRQKPQKDAIKSN